MTLRAERDPEPTTPGGHRQGWATWTVLDADGTAVGTIAEDRPWLGDRFGPPTYSVAHRPDPTGHALWRADDLPTVPAALDALAAHLAP